MDAALRFVLNLIKESPEATREELLLALRLHFQGISVNECAAAVRDGFALRDFAKSIARYTARLS